MQFPRKRRITFAIIAGSASIALAILLWNWMPTADAKPVDTSRAHFEPWKQIADRYETLHGQHLDATYDDVQSHIARQAEYVDKLSFDPEKVRFFDLVKYRLKLTNEEVSKFKKDGFVAIDQGRPQSFPAAYQQVYTSDLPVFITTDSILHALHRSYDALELLVGRSDNLSAWQLLQVSRDAGFDSAISLRDENSVRLLQNAITKGNHGQQLIRSQVVRSSATVPAIYQLFGQRFVIDSYVLSKVVHDEIVFDGFLVKRMMPTGLDVMAALGNAEAVPLLKDELETWHYGANLIACNELVDELDAKFWAQSVSNIWLDSLRSLDDDLTQQTHAPEVMKTQLWQTKQLQTQLASWAELRHDNILYAKQSYGVPGCAFPDGYVEPYPAFYRKLRLFATTAQQLLKNMQLKARDKEREEHLIHVNEQQIAFFAEMAQTMNLLEQIATKELQGDPLSTVEISFLKGAFDDQGQVKFGSSSKPDYNGWYCRLYYERAQSPSRWAALDLKPTIADVHTDPHNRKVLEVGVGSAHLAVIAVDQGETSTAYVGPIYSYYEFAQPVSQRLTDEEWTKMLTSGEAPARPAWAKPLLVSATHRSQSKPNATLRRFDGEPKGALQSNGGSRSVGISDSLLKRIGQYKHVPSLDLSNAPITDEGLAYLSNLVDLRSMNLSNTKITDAALQHLSQHQHLQFLDLSSTKISDAELTHLERCVHLSILDLRKTQVTSEGVKRLKASLPHTEILR